MNASAAQFIGILIACGAAAGALLAGDARLRYGCALVALMAAPMLIAGDVWDSSRLVALRHPPEKLAVVVVVAIAGAAVVARSSAASPGASRSPHLRSFRSESRCRLAARPPTSSCLSTS